MTQPPNDQNEKVYEAAMGLLRLSFYKKEFRKTRKNRLQIVVLETIFNLTSHPSTSTQIDLAILLNMSVKSVKIWFQNARQQRRRKMEESGELNSSDLVNDDLINVPVQFIIEKIKHFRKEYKNNYT